MLKIGIVDSGMGGLSILRGLISGGINAEYYYLYDNAHLPYGTKTQDELVALGFAAMQKLMRCGVDVVIIACNTLTSMAVGRLRQMFSLPIIGVEPPIKPAAQSADNILLLATPATLKSERVVDMLHSFTDKNFYYPDVQKLAGLVETHFDNHDEIYRFLKGCTQKYTDIDGIVIGCTHYNFVISELKNLYPAAKIFSNVDGVTRRVKYILAKNKVQIAPHLLVKVIVTGEPLAIEKQYFLCKYLDFGIQFL